LEFKASTEALKKEYIQAKQAYDAVLERIRNDGDAIDALIQQREVAYNKFLEVSLAEYSPPAEEDATKQPSSLSVTAAVSLASSVATSAQTTLSSSVAVSASVAKSAANTGASAAVSGVSLFGRRILSPLLSSFVKATTLFEDPPDDENSAELSTSRPTSTDNCNADSDTAGPSEPASSGDGNIALDIAKESQISSDDSSKSAMDDDAAADAGHVMGETTAPPAAEAVPEPST
jgi:hypothetical protein